MKDVKEIYTEFSEMEIEEIFKLDKVDENGLTEKHAQNLLELHGKNIIDQAKPKPWYYYLIKSFLDPFSIVLMIIAVVMFFTNVVFAPVGQKDWTGIIVILFLVVLSSLLEFSQNYRSNLSAAHLKKMVSNTATAIRNGQEEEIPMEDIVVSDIVKLSAGDMVPADCRVIWSKDLFISEGSLTGEANPVEKFSDKLTKEAESITDLNNICFMGTNVISGTGKAIVIASGNETYFGGMAKDLTGEKPKTAFEKGIISISRLLIRFMLVMVPVIFVIVSIVQRDILNSFLFAISIAVGLTPELLPMIMATTLGKGANAMSKKKTIVKNLSAIQTFGAMDILCTDKTGTLTEDRITVEKYLDIHGNDDDRVLSHALFNSYFQTGLKSNIDIAIIERAKKNGIYDDLNNYEKIDEIPFDFERRRMSVIIQNKDKNRRQIVTKGAVEEMIKICNYAEYQKQVIEMTDEIRNEALQISDKLNKEGLRIIAVAQKHETVGEKTFDISDESDMVLMGFVGFLDPPKESASSAVKALNDNGVRVIVLTGDNELVTRSVCKEVGINTDRIVLGAETDNLDDKELFEVTETVNIFVKLSPLQKARIVNTLQAHGHVVRIYG